MTSAREVIRRNLQKALKEGRLEDAAGLLERLRREAPLELPTRGLELEYLLAFGRLDEADALAGQLASLFPTSARIFFLAGRTAYARREYGRALEHFSEASRLAPHWRVRYWIGKTLTQMGRLDEAEAILLEIVEAHPLTVPSLAWLHERRGELSEAIRLLEGHCARHREDRFAAAQLERLRARSLDPERLQEEVENLLELGEEISPELLAEHVEGLLKTGQGPRVRELLPTVRPGLDPRTALRIAWICHRHGMPDLACSLFLEQLPSKLGDVKLLSALEKDARLAGRTEELIATYRELASRRPQLWSRVRRLSRL
ncbi:MAG: tetratricopeptide repeat protein, partial [Acidobacteria bacterium]|nr:tetratricopeptide repeat protein [Acidobacteriota bacterium]